MSTSSELIEVAERLGGQRVLLFGDLMLDRYVYGDAERISPEAPVPVLRAVERQTRVGGSGSVASNLTALGLEVTCCGIVGNDADGEELIKLLSASGAAVSGVLKVQDRPTTTKTRFVGLAQHRHRQQLLRFDEEVTSPITDRQIDYLLRVMEKAVDKSDVVCIEDYNKGLVGPGVVARLVEIAARHHKKILVDPAAIGSFERYRGTTILTPNRNELSTACGRKFESLEEMGAAACQMAADLGLEAVVITVDREGAILSRADGQFVHIPTRPRPVYDNTGAGDAVLAMLAAAVAAGASLPQAVQLANIAGGLEVEKFGCVPITKNEILADLRIEHRRRSGKLRTPEELVSELALRRDRGETVVFTNGCFDLLHRGHVEYLQEASEHGDILVVGLNSDASIRKQNKGADRPIVSQEDRAAVLAGLQSVDYVVVFDEETPLRLIEAIRPSVLVKGEDWKDKGVVGKDVVQNSGGKIILAKLREGHSTSALIQKIKNQ